MPATYTTLALTNDTIGDPSPIVADLVDNANYQLLDSSWAPAVSARRKSRQAGQSPYEDVVEEITVNVLGSSAAVALNNLAKLTQLLDLADRFAEGDLSSPIWLMCQPQGSVLSDPVVALVLGRFDNGPPFLDLPPTFNDVLHQYEIGPVTIRFRRSGLWYGASDISDLVGPAEAPTVQTVTLGFPLVIPGPTRLVYTGFAEDTEALTESWILVASENYFSPDGLQLVEGETGSADASGVTLTVTNDAANNARSDEIAEITSPSTTAFEGVSWLLASAIPDKRATVLAAVRNNTSATWYMKVATRSSSGKEGQPSEVVTVLGSNNDPQIVNFGTVYNAEDSAAIRGYFKCSTTSGSPQLDIDYFVIMGRDNQQNYVLHLLPGSDFTDTNSVEIDPAALLAITPKVYGANTTVPWERPIGYDSDMWVATNGETLSAVFCACRENYWRWSDSSNAVLQASFRAIRILGYLTPQ